MIEFDIPGFGVCQLAHLVMDYNGTLATDGRMIAGVEGRLAKLSDQLHLHVVTADTFGAVEQALNTVDCRLHMLRPGRQDTAKQDYVRTLGANGVASIGNGRNDRLMLKTSAIGIGLIQAEGAYATTLMAADVVCNSILDALDLLIGPLRLTATLRN